MTFLRCLTLALPAYIARAARAAVEEGAIAQDAKEQYSEDAQGFYDHCRSIAEAECLTTDGCVWKQRRFGRSSCSSTCMDHNESTCPGITCRWATNLRFSSDKCIPRQDSEACAVYFPKGKRECMVHDCRWQRSENSTAGAYKTCVPKCQRYPAAECPRPECMLSGGSCLAKVPHSLPSDVQVTTFRDCKGLAKAACAGLGDCAWEQRRFSRSTCRSTCLDHNESTCPGVACRWMRHTFSKDTCLAREASDACWKYHDDKRSCVNRDCDWISTGYVDISYSYCVPKCFRYSAASCPDPECQLKEGHCHPKHLPNEILCPDLTPKQCEYLLPGQCTLLDLPKRRFQKLLGGVFGLRGHQVCEAHETIEYQHKFQKLVNKSEKGAMPDLLPTCRKHQTQESCEKEELCEWRVFHWDKRKQGQARCTVRWQSDAFIQTMAVAEAGRLGKLKAYGVGGLLTLLPSFAVGAGFGATMVSLFMMFVKIASLFGLALGPGNVLFAVCVVLGVLWTLGILTVGVGLPVGIAHSWGIEAFEVASEATTTWKKVKVASGNFCQELFAGLSPLEPNSVRTVSGRLVNAEGDCAEKLSGNGSRVYSAGPEHSRPRWMKATDNLCKDLCIDLVDTIHHNMANIMIAGGTRKLLQACAAMAIQPVESHILGCCAASCGWNATTQFCENWFFMRSEDRAVWMDECCSEIQIVNGSKRQVMCDSLATREEQAKMRSTDEPERVPDQKFLFGYSPAEDDSNITGFVGKLRSGVMRLLKKWKWLIGAKHNQTASAQEMISGDLPDELAPASSIQLEEEQGNDVHGVDHHSEDVTATCQEKLMQKKQCEQLTTQAQRACKAP